MIQKKRAQITLFVILGIVILIVAGLAIYVAKVSQSERPPDEVVIRDIPAEMDAIKTHVESCMNQVTKEGLVILGQNGGYLDLDAEGFYTINGLETEANALEFFPESDIIIPYWLYLKSSNDCFNCQYEFKKPSLESGDKSIKSQLEGYAEEKLVVCIDDFNPFRHKYEIIVHEDPQIEITFGERTHAKLKYPVTVELYGTDSPTSFEDFSTNLDINFKNVYHSASEIVATEYGSINYFEELAMYLIAFNAISKSSKLPPLAGPMETSLSGSNMWEFTEVNNNIKGLLSSYVPMVQTVGANNFIPYFSEDATTTAVYKNLLFNPSATNPDMDLGKLDVNYIYFPNWQLYLNINGQRAGVLLPQEYTMTFPIPFSLRQYEFSYSLAYPIVTQIYDQDAFNGEGYMFRFGMEINVRNNEALVQNQNMSLSPYEESSMPDLFSNPENFKSGEITVYVKDYVTNEPLDNVYVSFSCVSSGVGLGQALIDDTGDSVVKGKLPLCLGGILSGIKEGYFPRSTMLNTFEGYDSTITLFMEPETPIKVKPVKKLIRNVYVNIVDTQWNYTNVSQDIRHDEHMLAIFERVTGPTDNSFIKVVEIKGDNFTFPEIKLVSGNYTARFMLFRNYTPPNELTIPGYKYQDEDGNDKTTDPMILNSSFMTGMAIFDNNTGYLEIDFDILSTKDTLTVYIPNADMSTAKDITDIDIISDLEDYSVDYKTDIWPVFS